MFSFFLFLFPFFLFFLSPFSFLLSLFFSFFLFRSNIPQNHPLYSKMADNIMKPFSVFFTEHSPAYLSHHENSNLKMKSGRNEKSKINEKDTTLTFGVIFSLRQIGRATKALQNLLKLKGANVEDSLENLVIFILFPFTIFLSFIIKLFYFVLFITHCLLIGEISIGKSRLYHGSLSFFLSLPLPYSLSLIFTYCIVHCLIFVIIDNCHSIFSLMVISIFQF